MSQGANVPHYTIMHMSNPGVAQLNRSISNAAIAGKYKKTIETWNSKASDIDIRSEFEKALPALVKPWSQLGYGHTVLQEELERTGERFLYDARNRIEERKMLLEAEQQAKIKKKDAELIRASRIVGVQNAFLFRVYETNRELFLKVLQDANITPEDIQKLQEDIELIQEYVSKLA